VALYSQVYTVKGKVVDANTNRPLAFVNIVINDSNKGSVTDIDGQFQLNSKNPIHKLQLSYIGYETLSFLITDFSKEQIIEMSPEAYNLSEVEIFSGENPAHRIIRNVLNNRYLNDPEKLNTFSYTSYDKMVITSDIDSVIERNQDLLKKKSLQEIKTFFDHRDIFLMETVSKRKFMKPDRNYNKVIAHRISGLKNPFFAFMISEIQSTSFYKPTINLVYKRYVNPISKGSFSKYFFNIKDTIYTFQGDTIFQIAFHPRKGTNFAGLKGVISINSNKWAIQNVRTEPTSKNDMFSIQIQQLYSLIDGKQWFPVQLNTVIKLNRDYAAFNTNAGDSIEKDLTVVAIGKSYIKNIVINPELVKREFSNIEVEIDPKSSKRDEVFWNKYRVKKLSQRDLATYHFADSLGKEENLDRKMYILRAMMTGRLPAGKIDFFLNEFINYNDYEGFHFGVGIQTNQCFSEWLKLGGVFAYGTKDNQIKYRGNLGFVIDQFQEVDLDFSMYRNVFESGGVFFFDDEKSLLNLDNMRNLLIKRMNLTKGFESTLKFRALRDFKFQLGLHKNEKLAFSDYLFNRDVGGVPTAFNSFHFTEFSFSFRFAYKEKFYKYLSKRISKGTRFPIVQFKYSRGLDGFLNGAYKYNRFDLRISDTFYFNYLGETKIRIQAGIIDGDVPYCNLFNGIGSYRSFTVYAPNSFATMRMNEFLSSRYVAVFLSHNFGSLLFKSKNKKFSPEFAIAINFAIGDLKYSENHVNINFNTLEKGYFESGILFNKLLNLKLYYLGLGVFYRYGPYSLPKTKDNLAVKLTFTFGIFNK
jgi:hypothetical protein